MLSMQQHSSCQSRNGIFMDGGDENSQSSPLTTSNESRPTSTECASPCLASNDGDTLYRLVEVVLSVLVDLKIEYFVTIGSQLDGSRSESLPSTIRDVVVAVIDDDRQFRLHRRSLPGALSREAHRRSSGMMTIIYQHRKEWDHIKSTMDQSNASLNLMVFTKYETRHSLLSLGNAAKCEELLSDDSQKKIQESMPDAAFPLYHFDNLSAMERMPQCYFTENELRPLRSITFGPLTVLAPSNNVGPFKRVFGSGCLSHEGSITPALLDRALLSARACPFQHFQERNYLKLAPVKTESDVEPGRITPPSSATIGGLSRTRSHFAFIVDTQSLSMPTMESQSLTVDQSSCSLPETNFGSDVRQYIGNDPSAPVFDMKLRAVMEPHIARARTQRERNRNPILMSRDPSIASAIGVPYTALRDERRFLFDPHSHPLHHVLAETLGVEDLSQLHMLKGKDKDELLLPLLTRDCRRRFHECYVNFVTSFCIPLLHSLAMTKNVLLNSSSHSNISDVTYRFQAFPSVSVILPGDSSIGPSCDSALGHSIGNLNFHVPLTPVFGTNALFAESHPGREDWHGFATKSPGLGFLFDGARCLHFTLDNTTDETRVSIDFRVAIYSASTDEDGLCPKELLADRFSNAGPGFYDDISVGFGARSLFSLGDMYNNRSGTKKLIDPDARSGHPFTMQL